MIRFVFALMAVWFCLWMALFAARTGMSRVAAKDALATSSLEAADRAVSLSASDAEAHYARAVMLSLNGATAEALREYERAAALRPRDYFLWLTLGAAREEAGDVDGALAALRESVRLAPYYAQPRWQLGNALLRSGGKQKEAFDEMRRAAESDPRLLPALIDIVWATTGNDPASVEQIIQPRDDSAHLALARFFVRKGRITEAMAHFNYAGSISKEERGSLLQALMAAKHYREAYEVWLSGQENKGDLPLPGSDTLIDGGFERSINLDEVAFGWRIPRSVDGVQPSLDVSERKEGAQSLLLEWKGNANPALQVVSQLIQLQPNARYRINFSARTSDIVTGGLPVVVVSEAESGRKLGESEALEKNSNNWVDYSVEFTTGADTTAVLLTVQRQSCSSNPCPMFGKVWLDAFSLQRV